MKETVIIYLAHAAEEASHVLLRRAASLLTGFPEEEFSTEKAPMGKPYLTNHPELHFSVSHSGKLWICAFAAHEIGCDIQLHTTPKRPDAIVQRYFHPHEQEAYASADDKLTAFHRIWCRKEAAVKLTGHGIDRTFRETDTTDPTCGIRDVETGYAGYSCAAAYDRDFTFEIRTL